MLLSPNFLRLLIILSRMPGILILFYFKLRCENIMLILTTVLYCRCDTVYLTVLTIKVCHRLILCMVFHIMKYWFQIVTFFLNLWLCFKELCLVLQNKGCIFQKIVSPLESVDGFPEGWELPTNGHYYYTINTKLKRLEWEWNEMETSPRIL